MGRLLDAIPYIVLTILIGLIVLVAQVREADIQKCTRVYAIGREACVLAIDRRALTLPTATPEETP
jgi:hypothetical protein